MLFFFNPVVSRKKASFYAEQLFVSSPLSALSPRIQSIHLSRFGGSAAVTCLKPCQICLATARAEERQRQFELSEFQLLRENDKIDISSSGDCYLLVTSWFSTWESWVLGKAREPPGKCLILQILSMS